MRKNFCFLGQELASQRVHETECIFKIEDTDLKNEGVDVIVTQSCGVLSLGFH